MAIKLCLIVKILEGERQLLALGYAFNREIKPGLVTILLIRGAVMGDPKEVFVPLSTFANSGEIATAEITVKSDHRISAFLKFLGSALWMNGSQILLVWMCQREVCWVFCKLIRDALSRGLPACCIPIRGPSPRRTSSIWFMNSACLFCVLCLFQLRVWPCISVLLKFRLIILRIFHIEDRFLKFRQRRSGPTQASFGATGPLSVNPCIPSLTL